MLIKSVHKKQFYFNHASHLNMNPSFIDNSFLRKISTKWDPHPLTSSSNQDVFLKTLIQTVIQIYLNLSANKINWYLLTCVINATCKNK